MRCLVGFSRAKLIALLLLAGYKLCFNTLYICQQSATEMQLSYMVNANMGLNMGLNREEQNPEPLTQNRRGDPLQPLNLIQDAGPDPAKIHDYLKSAGRILTFSHDSTFHESQAEWVGVISITKLNEGTLRAPDGFSQSVAALAKALLNSYNSVPNKDGRMCQHETESCLLWKFIVWQRLSLAFLLNVIADLAVTVCGCDLNMKFLSILYLINCSVMSSHMFITEYLGWFLLKSNHW